MKWRFSGFFTSGAIKSTRARFSAYGILIGFFHDPASGYWSQIRPTLSPSGSVAWPLKAKAAPERTVNWPGQSRIALGGWLAWAYGLVAHSMRAAKSF